MILYKNAKHRTASKKGYFKLLEVEKRLSPAREPVVTQSQGVLTPEEIANLKAFRDRYS